MTTPDGAPVTDRTHRDPAIARLAPMAMVVTLQRDEVPEPQIRRGDGPC